MQYAKSSAAAVVLALAAWPAVAADVARQSDLKLITEGERAWRRGACASGAPRRNRRTAQLPPAS